MSGSCRTNPTFRRFLVQGMGEYPNAPHPENDDAFHLTGLPEDYQHRFMEPANLLATSPPFKDRKTGLLVFGILEIIAGAFCALLVPLLFFGQAMNSRMTGSALQFRLVLPAVAVYAMLAAVFVILASGPSAPGAGRAPFA